MSLEQLSDKVRVLLRDHAIDNFANEARWLVARRFISQTASLLVNHLVSSVLRKPERFYRRRSDESRVSH